MGTAERLGGAHRAALLKAFAAEDGTALGWAKRDRGLLTALRAVGLGFGAHGRCRTVTSTFGALGFARLATFGLVLEALVGEEHLFAGSENKFGATLRALQHLVMVFHEPLPLDPARAGDASLAL